MHTRTEIVRTPSTPARWAHRIAATSIAALGLFISPGIELAHAQSYSLGASWSVPGSVGTVDEASTASVRFDQVKASVRPTAPAGTVVYLRYPVSIVPYWMFNIQPPFPYDLAQFYSGMTFTLSFQKNDDAAIIVAGLRRVRLSDGETTLLLALDTGSTLPDAAVQQVMRSTTCGAPCMLPNAYAYFVEVALWKAQATSDPKLVGLSVTLTP